MTHFLSDYEQELKKEWVKEEIVQRVTENTTVAVLCLKGGYELACHVTDNAISKDFDEEELTNKALKKAYEELEKFDRFYKRNH